jgi:hypothetical protein
MGRCSEPSRRPSVLREDDRAPHRVLGEFQTEIHADDTAAIVLTRVADASEPAIAQMAEVRQTVKTN